MTYYVTHEGDSLEEARANFSWDIPADYNIAADLIQKHDDPDRVALYQEHDDGSTEEYTFAELDAASNRLANALESLGVERGDRVAINVPQKPATLLTHLACWKLGAISVPLSVLFGKEALEYRLVDSSAEVIVADESVVDVVEDVVPKCPDLAHVIEVDGDGEERPDFDSLLADHPPEYDVADTTPETPAILLYTSGSTGPPKGVLHNHKILPAHCSGYAMYFGNGDVEGQIMGHALFHSHAEWAWIGSLFISVLPAWHYGRPIVGYPFGAFDPEKQFALWERFDVTHAFVAPTALRSMMTVDEPTEQFDLDIEVIMSGSEPVTSEIYDWVEGTFEDVVLNEVFGQTETGGVVICDCANWFENKTGSMGRPVPGHDLAIVNSETGEELPPGEIGEIAVDRRNDPGVFEEYWNEPEKTEAARLGDWHLTGDLGTRDEADYYEFESRKDDLINTSGYRVGPGEVEDMILEHPDVEQTGVIGVPNDQRGEIIKAYVQPVPGVDDYERLRTDLKEFVREELAKYKYPREIEFIDDIPQTVTGKIQRTELRQREGLE